MYHHNDLEVTLPTIRAIGVSDTACKDEFRQNIRSHSWSVFSFLKEIPRCDHVFNHASGDPKTNRQLVGYASTADAVTFRDKHRGLLRSTQRSDSVVGYDGSGRPCWGTRDARRGVRKYRRNGRDSRNVLSANNACYDRGSLALIMAKLVFEWRGSVIDPCYAVEVDPFFVYFLRLLTLEIFSFSPRGKNLF